MTAKEYRNKMKRMEPVIKAKKVIMEKESIKLKMLKAKKVEVDKEMEESKGNYVMGVQNLNILRQSQDRLALEALEACVDSCKNRWTNLFRESQILEKKVQFQIGILNSAQQKLKAAEIMNEKYDEMLKIEISHQEQKNQDEISSTKHFLKTRD